MVEDYDDFVTRNLNRTQTKIGTLMLQLSNWQYGHVGPCSHSESCGFSYLPQVGYHVNVTDEVAPLPNVKNQIMQDSIPARMRSLLQFSSNTRFERNS